MKKIINIILVMAIVLSYFIPIQLTVYADDCLYRVSVLSSSGQNDLSCHNDYNSARDAMLNYNSNKNNIAVVLNSNGRIINAKYAIAKLTPGNVIYMYPTATSSSAYTSINTSYGIDAAFLDYDINSNRAKIRISGYTGWVNVGGNNNVVRVLVDNIRIREQPNTNSSTAIIGQVYDKNNYVFYNKHDDGKYIWYQIKTTDANGTEVYGWFASEIGKNWTEEPTDSTFLTIQPINRLTNFQTFYEPYLLSGNLIHYYEHRIRGEVEQAYTNLGPNPSFLDFSVTYYSFDGNYYYHELADMLDDYRDNTSNRAVNANKPYYPYYMYLSTRSKTGYTAYDFNKVIRGPEENPRYTRNIDSTIQYVKYDESTGNYYFDNQINRTGISLMYDEGQSFVDVANTYGVNALMMFGTAINESYYGTSLIAFLKKNLFGIGAVDSNPVNGARSYNTVKDSIIDFAIFTGSNDSNYSNPERIYYYGSHYGNKGSGMNVKYATDPYWGEKQAGNSFINDKSFGLQDYLANTIGVTNKFNVKLYKEPYSTSGDIYTLKNNYAGKDVYNIPVVVADKVYTTENGITSGWYKVYSDVALDDNKNIADVPYDFNKSYGYIKEADLYVANKQPVISASDKSILQGQSIDLKSGVTASDTEDGNLTNRITVSGTYDINVPGDYNITYTVLDNSNFSASKTITLTVVPTENPIIIASNKQIPQYVQFDPKVGVIANDYKDGDLTSRIEVIENNVNINVRGKYSVTYRVIDDDNNETTKTIEVEVIVNEAPVINAQNYTIKVNNSFDPKSGVTAIDKEDGDLTSLIEVTENEVDITKVGTYQVTYEVIDTAGNKTTATVTITVEEQNYIDKKGEFYFEKMEWNRSTNKLDIAGYLAITGVNNTRNDNIKYDLILRSNTNNNEVILPLERWLDNHPNRSYNDGTYNYSETWFKGSVDLSSILAGEYTMYVRARLGTYQAINLFRNVFGKTMTRKVQTNNNRGYLFRNNNYKTEFPIELFIRDNGLISEVEPTHSSNMYTSYRALEFKNSSLNIIGSSYNINGDYSQSANIERYLILENMVTFERYTYNIGSIVGDDIPLRVSDGKSKVRGWFDTTNKVNLTNLPVGKYIIYIRTKTGNIDDYGELNDIFLKATDNIKTTINNKEYSISLNKNLRFRLELNVITK